MEEACDEAREHAHKHGYYCSQPDVHSADREQYADGSACRERAVNRQVGNVEHPVGDVYADGHNAPHEALAHGAGQPVQQRLQELHYI